MDVIISVPEQKMVVLRDGGFLKKYKVSTSRFGLGDSHGSYKTPLGRMRVWEKLGGDLPSGAVLKNRAATGEILAANAPGRDPIVSRILWLEGIEPQNDNARGRGIYIHGTTEESLIGKPVSWGCIRMRSEDVIELYEMVDAGALVTITEDRLASYAKWRPQPRTVFVASQTAATTGRAGAQRLSPVAEMLRPLEKRITPADFGAANAFRGSILFAGLPTVQKAAPKKLPRPVPPVAAEFWLPGELLASATSALLDGGFSLRERSAVPPMALIDLRRGPQSPLAGNTSMLDAPIPTLAFEEESDRETTMSAIIQPARSNLH